MFSSCVAVIALALLGSSSSPPDPAATMVWSDAVARSVRDGNGDIVSTLHDPRGNSLGVAPDALCIQESMPLGAGAISSSSVINLDSGQPTLDSLLRSPRFAVVHHHLEVIGELCMIATLQCGIRAPRRHVRANLPQ
jgi:hypothetical protein